MTTTNDPVNDTTALEVREAGLGQLPPPPVGDLPAGGGKWPVPHHLTKIGLINQVARSYRWSVDESLKNSRQNAVAMLRDTEVLDAIQTRLVPTSQLAWHLEPQDATDPAQLAAVTKLEEVIRRTPRLTDFHKSNLWAVWHGRYATQLTYQWDYSHPDSQKRMVVKDWKPINGDSLVARWSGDWGLLVNSYYDGPKEPTDRGFAHFFTPAEREAIVVHTHESFDSDFYEPEKAGAVRGIGVREGVYWYWWLAGNFMALVADYAERFANGVWFGWFDDGNPEGQDKLGEVLSQYRNSNVLSFPRNKLTGASAYGVDLKEVGTASPQFLFDIVQYLRATIRKYICGTNIALETSIGIGGDVAGLEEDRISRIVKYDAEKLGETYTTDWLPVLCRYNCGPLVPPPRWKFVVDRPNAGQLIGYAKAIHDLGGDVDLDQLYEAAGLRQATGGGAVSSKLQPMSPTAVTGVPQGVPMATSDQQPPPQQQQQPATVPQQSQQLPVTIPEQPVAA